MASAAETAVVLFKRGAKGVSGVSEDPLDEEKTAAESGRGTHSSTDDKEEAQKALAETSPMMDMFSWQHLQYTVPVGNGATRKLLDDVSGYVAPGKLTALMGESGAGKTTLLNVLAQRVTSGVVTGDRLVNGQSLPADFQAQTGYVQQMDTHVPTTTVREALLFSAKLRQPLSVSLAEKEAYVETCLKLCGLAAYGDAMVGSLDIEFRKRTTIGVELAAKPKLLLFLDEVGNFLYCLEYTNTDTSRSRPRALTHRARGRSWSFFAISLLTARRSYALSISRLQNFSKFSISFFSFARAARPSILVNTYFLHD